jgi:hypothetical protein
VRGEADDQRVRTRIRLWKPMRYQRWTSSQALRAAEAELSPARFPTFRRGRRSSGSRVAALRLGCEAGNRVLQRRGLPVKKGAWGRGDDDGA